MTYLNADSGLQQQPNEFDIFVLDGSYQRGTVQRVHAVDVELVRVVLVLRDDSEI